MGDFWGICLIGWFGFLSLSSALSITRKGELEYQVLFFLISFNTLPYTEEKKIKDTIKSLDYSFWHKIYECTFEGWALLFFYSQCACHFKRLYTHWKWNSVHRQYPCGLFNIKRVLESWMSSWSFCHSWIKKPPTYLCQQPLTFKRSIPNISIVSMWINFYLGSAREKIIDANCSVEFLTSF